MNRGEFVREIWQCNMNCLECAGSDSSGQAGAASREEVMRNWWRLSAIGMLTAGLMLAFGSTPSMAAPRAHVYLLRGLMNIFSLGMDTLAEELNRRGVYATVDNHADWESLADSAAANYKAGKEGPIILIGHSLGADAVMAMAAYLGRRGVPVALVVPFDGTASFAASANVARVLNLTQHYYMSARAGLPRLADQCRSAVRSEHRSSQYRQIAAAACARDCRSARHRRLAPHRVADCRCEAATGKPENRRRRRGGQAGRRSPQPHRPKVRRKDRRRCGRNLLPRAARR